MAETWIEIGCQYAWVVLTHRSIPVLAAVYLLYFVLHSLYNLYLHPLSAYPGPKLNAISRLPLTRHLLKGTQVYWIHEVHEKYGHVVRVAPDQLSFTDERAWLDISGSTPAAKYGMAKDERLNDLVGGDTMQPDLKKSRQEQKHTQLRQAFAPGLTKAALKQQRPLIEKHINEAIDEIRIRSSAGIQSLDVLEIFNYIGYNVFSDLFLGDPFDLFHVHKYKGWVESIPSFARTTMSMAALQYFVIIRYFLAFIIAKFGKKYRDAFMDVCFDRFDRRAAQVDSDHVDLFHFATKETTKHRDLTTKDLREFSPFLMLAGGETTPTSLGGLTFCLLKHPDKFSRLREEIRTAFQHDEEMTMEKLFKLPYLSACIDETLRYYPPIATGIERVVPKGGAPICGKIVPGGTVVLIAQYATQRSSKNFVRADEWCPERYLAGDERPAEFTDDKRNAARPFSVGPHSCFGQDLAHYIMRLILCKLIVNYDLELHADDQNWMEIQHAYFGWMKPELRVYLTPRKV